MLLGVVCSLALPGQREQPTKPGVSWGKGSPGVPAALPHTGARFLPRAACERILAPLTVPGELESTSISVRQLPLWDSFLALKSEPQHLWVA